MYAHGGKVVAAHSQCVCVWKVYFHSWWRNPQGGQMCERERERESVWDYENIEREKNDSFKLLAINEALHATHFHVSLNFRTIAVFFFSPFFRHTTHLHIVCKATYVRLWRRRKKHAKILYTLIRWFASNVCFVSYLFIYSKWTIYLFSHTKSSLFALSLDLLYW